MSAKFDPSDLEDVRVLLARGMTQTQIAAELGFSRHAVSRLVAQLRADRHAPTPKRPRPTPPDALFPLGATSAGEALTRLVERFPLGAAREDFLSVVLTTVPPDDDQPRSAAAMNGIVDMLAEAVAQLVETNNVMADVAGQIRDLVDRLNRT